MKHIIRLENISDYTAFRNSENYIEPHVSAAEGETTVNYNDPIYTYTRMPLTFEILDAVPNGSNIDTTSGNGYYTSLGTPDGEGGFVLPDIDLWYSLNGGPWTQYGAEYIAAHPSSGYWYQGIPVKTGDIIQFKGDNPTVDYPVFSYGHEFHFGTRGVSTLKIYGNVASIIDSTNYASITEYDAGIPDYFTNKGYGSSGYYFFDCGDHYNNPNSCDCTHLIYPKNPWISTPLTVEVNASSTFYISDGEGVRFVPDNLYYKINSGDWQQFTTTNNINLSSGDTIQFKGDLTDYLNNNFMFNFSNDAIYDIKGNPLSILDSTNYATATGFNDPDDFNFFDQKLFSRCVNVLILTKHYQNGWYPQLMLPFNIDLNDYPYEID